MIAPSLLLIGLVLAADPASYPLATTMELPEADLLRLDLGHAWASRCPDPGSYLLLDDQGRDLPFAVRTSDDAAPWRREHLRWEPLPRSGGWEWLVQPPASGEPARALRIGGLQEGAAALLSVRQGDGPPLQAVVWHKPGTGAGSQVEIPLPAELRQGPWRVHTERVEGPGWPRLSRDPGFQALVAQPWTVEEASLELHPGEPVPTGPTTSDRLLLLPRAGLPLRGLTVEVEEPVFHRELTLLEGGDPLRLTRIGGGTVERVRILERGVDSPGIALRGQAGAELVLRSEHGRGAPLDLRTVELSLRGLALAVPRVDAGRYTLLGCGPSGPGYDLEQLEARLAELPHERVGATAPATHEGWEARSAGGALLEAGPLLDREGFAWERSVRGEPGLVRLPLDSHAMAHTLPGQADLRFVDASGAQLPYLLREDPAGSTHAGLVYTREEREGVSVLTVTLPEPGLPALGLVIRSDRGLFEREVRVQGGSPERPVVLAQQRWQGSEEGESRAVIPLDRRLDGPLRIALDNGDNPPLPVRDLALVTRAASAWLALPAEGEVTALYGKPALDAPRYDLQLLRERVLTQPADPGMLAPPRALGEPPKDPPTRGLLLASVAVLSLLLLLLIGRLARAPEAVEER